jgi:hypothetical protein
VFEKLAGQLLLVLDGGREGFEGLGQLANTSHKLLVLLELAIEMSVDAIELVDQLVESLFEFLAWIPAFEGRDTTDHDRFAGGARRAGIGEIARGVKPTGEEALIIQSRLVPADGFVPMGTEPIAGSRQDVFQRHATTFLNSLSEAFDRWRPVSETPVPASSDGD